MRLTIELTGVSPLVMENPRMSDPDDPLVQEIKKITSKRTLTEHDRREKERLQFAGSLYIGSDGPVIPTLNLRGCWYKAGTATRNGADIERSVLLQTVEVPVEYNGPRTIEGLWDTERHRFRAMVAMGQGKSKSRVPRMRPMFPDWSLSVEIELLTQFLDVDQFVDIVASAGMIEGLGGARKIGYGRYTSLVKPA